MAEEFQGGVCGGTWWNLPRNLFSGGGGSALSSPCSVAQLGGGIHDMSNFGWSNEVTKGRPNAHSFEKNNSSICDNSSLMFPSDMDSTLDILGFGLSTVDWNQQNLICNDGGNEGNFDSILQDEMNSGLSYGMKSNSPSLMNSNSFSSNNSCNQGDGSPPMTMTASSNSSGDSSTITSEGGLNTSFPMSSRASYLIQTLFDDSDDSNLINPNFGAMSSSELLSPCDNSWVKSSTVNNSIPVQPLPAPSVSPAQTNKFDQRMNLMNNNNGGQVLNGQYPNGTTLSNVRASLLNSLQSRSRASSFNKNSSHNCANLSTKTNDEEARKSNISEQPQAKRPRIETPSPLPTFKVRKEKLGDRITALQQLVSPFGKTDTASVLHEAIEYIKFLHDQVNVLSTPYLKNGATVQHQQGSEIKDNEESSKHDLRSRGLCLVPISSTYPVAQETPVDFWTPTFGGTAFR